MTGTFWAGLSASGKIFRLSLVALLFITGTLGIALDSDGRPIVEDNWQAEFMRNQSPQPANIAKRGPPSSSDPTVQLVITNNCEATIWPALATQAGTGPGTGGFGLAPGKSKKLAVSWNWQGRIWGRTNCTVNGESCACQTGDCFAKLDCQFSVS